MASKVEKRIAEILPVFIFDKLTLLTPTFSDNSFKLIFRSAMTRSNRGSLTLAHSQNSQMSFMYGFFFVKFLFFTVVCVVIVV